MSWPIIAYLLLSPRHNFARSSQTLRSFYEEASTSRWHDHVGCLVCRQPRMKIKVVAPLQAETRMKLCGKVGPNASGPGLKQIP